MNLFVVLPNRPRGLWRRGNTVDNQVVADEQCLFHRTGWDAEGLQVKSQDEERRYEKSCPRRDLLYHALLLTLCLCFLVLLLFHYVPLYALPTLTPRKRAGA